MAQVCETLPVTPVHELLEEVSDWQFAGEDDFSALGTVMRQRLGEAAVYGLAGPFYTEYGAVYRSAEGVAWVQIAHEAKGGPSCYDRTELGVIVATTNRIEQIALQAPPNANPVQRAGALAIAREGHHDRFCTVLRRLETARVSGPYSVIKYDIDAERLSVLAMLGRDILTLGSPDPRLTNAFTLPENVRHRHPMVHPVLQPTGER